MARMRQPRERGSRYDTVVGDLWTTGKRSPAKVTAHEETMIADVVGDVPKLKRHL